jgi:Fe-Mn family superoxide dismutase
MAFQTPDLPYEYDALEPHIDKATMTVHHDKHHTGYTTKLNNAIQGTEYENWDIEKLIASIDSLPDNIKTPVRNAGGGHYNHSLFWPMMKKGGGGQPTGALAEEINKTFGSFDEFKNQFKTAALGRFGSGWAWLVVNETGSLEIMSTPNQDNPLTQGKKPVLGIDVWEHAYYLKYQNKRGDYVDAFFNVINWDQIAKNYEAAK